MNKNFGVCCDVKQCRHNMDGCNCSLDKIKVTCDCTCDTCEPECTCCGSYEERV